MIFYAEKEWFPERERERLRGGDGDGVLFYSWSPGKGGVVGRG